MTLIKPAGGTGVVAWTTITARLVSIGKTITFPHAINDTIPIMYFDDVMFPFGVTIKHLSIRLPLDINYEVPFTERTVTDSSSAVATIATTGGTERFAKQEEWTGGESGQDAIAVNTWLYAFLPATPVIAVLGIHVVAEINNS